MTFLTGPPDLSPRYCCSSFAKSAGCTKVDAVIPVIALVADSSAEQKRGKAYNCGAVAESQMHRYGLETTLGCGCVCVCTLEYIFLPRLIFLVAATKIN